MSNEFDDYMPSVEEQQAMLDRDQPQITNLTESERLNIIENAVQDLIISTMKEGEI